MNKDYFRCIEVPKKHVKESKDMTPTEKFRHMFKELNKQDSVKILMQNLKNK